MAKGYTQDIYEILENKNRLSKPLFLYLSFVTKIYSKFSEPYIIKDRSKIIKNTDNTVGDIIDKLKKTGLYNNTLIIFISDNGAREITTHVKKNPLRVYKGSVYEGGTKVPAFFHSPAIKSYR